MLKPNNKDKVDRTRGKILQISREALLELFVKQANEIADREVTVVTRIALPDDWSIGNIFWNPSRRAFEVEIFSEEFPRVELGAEYPLLTTTEETAIDRRRWECKEEIGNKRKLMVAENLKALRSVAKEAGCSLSDAAEILAEICYQGFSYPESLNILKELSHTLHSDYRLDWKQELTKIIEKRQKYIQKYERRKSFEKALHHGLEATKEIRKKEIERELIDVNWTIQTLEKILRKSGPHDVMSSDLSEAWKRKRILMKELSSMNKPEGITCDNFIKMCEVIREAGVKIEEIK